MLPASRASLRRAVPSIGQIRGLATEKQLLEKMTATKGISKITSSMRMVAASKLRQDEIRLEKGKAFGGWTNQFLAEPVYVGEDGSNIPKAEDFGEKTLLVAICSDKGLCGGVNSYIGKAIKATANELNGNGKDFDIFIVGDKGRSALQGALGDSIITSINDSWSCPTNFAQVSAIATEVTAQDYDSLVLYYNEFKSVIAYNTMWKHMSILEYDPEATEVAEGSFAEQMAVYDVEPEDRHEAMQSLNEYATGSAMFSAFLDQATSFQSSQMTAMENATNNANEVIETLTIQYNRARQARITTELIEIISGASALDG